MSQEGAVLFFSLRLDRVRPVAAPLQEEGFEVVFAASPQEAIAALRERPFDLLIVDSAMAKPSAKEFLAKTRELLPRILRAVFEDAATGVDLRPLVNDASPCAVFAGSVEPSRVRTLIGRQRELFQNASLGADAVDARKDLAQFRDRIAQLEQENRRLTRQLAAMGRRPSAAGQAGVEALAGGLGARLDAGKRRAAEERAEFDKQQKAEIDPNAADMVDEVARVIRILLERPEIHLPVLPQVGAEAQKLTASETSSFEQIAEVVALDPGMSARILEVANSPLYAGVERIRSLRNAVSRIGIRETRNIVQAVACEDLFKSNDKRLSDLMGQLWMHSLAVAYSNEILAKALLIAESDDFFMMGLLHDAGKLLIIHLIEEGYKTKIWTRTLIAADLLQELFNRHHNAFGLRLMEKWDYPEPFRSVVSLHNDDEHVRQHDEAVVVTYYSNLLTRKLGFSLRLHDEAALGSHQIAQALNMSDQARDQILQDVEATVGKLRASYL
ncbi:MAG TPA: HDOD domain-containing protein [Sumerlaeia bacterium]|nr:HDOD domain-containing protein [Sumerlaeia bacterium]